MTGFPICVTDERLRRVQLINDTAQNRMQRFGKEESEFAATKPTVLPTRSALLYHLTVVQVLKTFCWCSNDTKNISRK